MEIVKYIIVGIYVIVCLIVIILAMLQSKGNTGASAAIVGSSSSENFYEKNKGRTREGKMKKWTIILGIVFVLLTIGLGIIYEFGK